MQSVEYVYIQSNKSIVLKRSLLAVLQTKEKNMYELTVNQASQKRVARGVVTVMLSSKKDVANYLYDHDVVISVYKVTKSAKIDVTNKFN